jgi:hypothetical protein
MQDPVVLGAGQARDGEGRHLAEDGLAVQPHELEVVQQPVVVVALLLDMPLEVPGDAIGDRVGGAHGLGATDRQLHQGNGGPDDRMRPDQVAGEHLGNPLVREHLLAGERERLSHQVDLPAKPQACGVRRPGDRRLHALSGRRRGAC